MAALVRPGDVIVFLGAPHLIDDVVDVGCPYGPHARAADGWGICLPGGRFTPPSPDANTRHVPAKTVR